MARRRDIFSQSRASRCETRRQETTLILPKISFFYFWHCLVCMMLCDVLLGFKTYIACWTELGYIVTFFTELSPDLFMYVRNMFCQPSHGSLFIWTALTLVFLSPLAIGIPQEISLINCYWQRRRCLRMLPEVENDLLHFSHIFAGPFLFFSPSHPRFRCFLMSAAVE